MRNILKRRWKTLRQTRCVNGKGGRKPLDRVANPCQGRVGVLLGDVPENTDQPTQTRFNASPRLGDIAEVRKSGKNAFCHVTVFLEKIAHRRKRVFCVSGVLGEIFGHIF